MQPVTAAASAATAHATRADRDRKQKQQQKPTSPKHAESDEVTTSPEALAAFNAADPDASGQNPGQSRGHPRGHPHSQSHPGEPPDQADPGSLRPVPANLPHLDIQG